MQAFDVIVKYGTGEKALGDAWNDFAKVLQRSGIGSVQEFKDLVAPAEQEWKAKFNRSLPAAYRSAKSTITKALTARVRILEVDGDEVSMRPKSVVTREIAERSVPTASIVDTMTAHVKAMQKLYRSIETPAEAAVTRDFITGLLDTIWE